MGGLFSKPKAPPPLPPPPPPTPMPDPDDQSIRKAKRREVAERRQRGGRLATILTDGTDKLGA